MINSLPVTVLIAARNEEKNIRKCLASLSPASEILVIDSSSRDETATIAGNEFGARVVNFLYQGGYPKKRQWAMDNLELSGEWILLIDADEEVPEKLWKEIAQVISAESETAGYLANKGFHFLGQKFRYGGFSHEAVVLFKKGHAHFEELFNDSADSLDMEVHERVLVNGPIGSLITPLIHDDFKGLEAYIDRHNRYSTWEARLRLHYENKGRYGQLTVGSNLFGNAQERRRFLKKLVLRLPFEPLIWFVYHYLFRLGILEGRRGLIACQIRAAYISQVRAKMFEFKETEQGAQ